MKYPENHPNHNLFSEDFEDEISNDELIIENDEPVINPNRTDQEELGAGIFLSEQVLDELHQGEIDGINFNSHRALNDVPQVELPGTNSNNINSNNNSSNSNNNNNNNNNINNNM